MDEAGYVNKRQGDRGDRDEKDFVLFTLLCQARDALAKARHRELRPVGINMMQAAVLYIVRAIGEPASPAEISRWLFREPNTVFVLVNRMVAQGLLDKKRDSNNRHLARVSLTEKGEQALKEARARRDKISSIMSCLSQEERAFLEETLERLRNRGLEELGMDRPLPYP